MEKNMGFHSKIGGEKVGQLTKFCSTTLRVPFSSENSINNHYICIMCCKQTCTKYRSTPVFEAFVCLF